MALTGSQEFCLWMIILGTVALIVGSLAPFWLAGPIANYGLWLVCTDGLSGSKCGLYAWVYFDENDFTVWFYVVHSAAGVATVIAIIILFASLVKVFSKSSSAFGVAAGAFTTGLFGISAAVVFYLKGGLSIDVLGAPFASISWSFYAFSAGTGLLAFLGLVLLLLPNSQAIVVQPH